jgi:hypothetical protein
MLFGLPFIPLEDVKDIFDEVMGAIHDDVHDLANYVEVNYVNGYPARGRRRAVAPRFPPNCWNVYSLVLSKAQRTNKTVESWHARFQKSIVTHHSSISGNLLNTLKRPARKRSDDHTTHWRAC